MIKELVEGTDGKTYERLMPETEAERRQLVRDAHAAKGGIDDRLKSTADPDEDFVDD